MESHWLFVLALVFLRLAMAQTGGGSGITSSPLKKDEASTDPFVTASEISPSPSSASTADERESASPTTTSVPTEVVQSNEVDSKDGSILSEEDQLLKADLALSNFLRDVLGRLGEMMKTGIPHLGVDSMDPLHLEDMNLKPLVGGEVFDVKMQHVHLLGLSDFRITQLESQTRESRIKLGLHFPKVYANCMFAANGTMYDIFSVSGNGNATLVFNEVHARTMVYLTKENGTLQVTSADQPYIDFSSAAITFRDDNRGGQEVSADSVATQLGPLYFWVFTASAVEKIDYPLALYLNDAMSKFVLPEAMARLSFRMRYLRVHVPHNPLPYAYVSPEYASYSRSSSSARGSN